MNLQDMFQQYGEIALNAAAKEPSELTESEQFAIALMAGCQTEMRSDHRGYCLAIKGSIGIQKIDGKFVVAQKF